MPKLYIVKNIGYNVLILNYIIQNTVTKKAEKRREWPFCKNYFQGSS